MDGEQTHSDSIYSNVSEIYRKVFVNDEPPAAVGCFIYQSTLPCVYIFNPID